MRNKLALGNDFFVKLTFYYMDLLVKKFQTQANNYPETNTTPENYLFSIGCVFPWLLATQYPL